MNTIQRRHFCQLRRVVNFVEDRLLGHGLDYPFNILAISGGQRLAKRVKCQASNAKAWRKGFLGRLRFDGEAVKI